MSIKIPCISHGNRLDSIHPMPIMSLKELEVDYVRYEDYKICLARKQQQKERSHNMTVTIKDSKTLVIEIDLLQPPQASKSGKTTVIASTHGNVPSDCQFEGKRVVIGLNAYVK